jgi:hypothetical protein
LTLIVFARRRHLVNRQCGLTIAQSREVMRDYVEKCLEATGNFINVQSLNLSKKMELSKHPKNF